MEVAKIVSDSAHYAAGFAAEPGKLLILAILNLVPVVDLLALGYFARVIQVTPISSRLPPMDRWGEMFVDGLKLLLISLCYLLAGIILTVLLYYLGSAPLALVGLIVIFLGFLLLPMALVHSVRTGDPARGFAIGEILAKVSYVGWFDYLLLLAAVFILPLILMVGLMFVPILGWLLLLLLGPAIGTFIARGSALVYPQ